MTMGPILITVRLSLHGRKTPWSMWSRFLSNQLIARTRHE